MDKLIRKVIAAIVSAAALVSFLTGCGELADAFMEGWEQGGTVTETANADPTPTPAASSEEREQEAQAGAAGPAEEAANSNNDVDDGVDGNDDDDCDSGDYFPFEFTAIDIYGNTVTEESLGKKELFFVHYWGTWCPPCVNEMPEMAEIVKEYGDRIGFIGLVDDYSSNASGARKIMDNSGVPQSFINVDADNDDLAELLKMVQSGYVPTTVIIDGEGNQVGEALVGAYGRSYGREIDMRLD